MLAVNLVVHVRGDLVGVYISAVGRAKRAMVSKATDSKRGGSRREAPELGFRKYGS